MVADAAALLRAGDLEGALAAAVAAVRAAPSDFAARYQYAETLLFAGQIDRADQALDAAHSLDVQYAAPIAEFRQLLRAETARRQWYNEGRAPEFLADPTETLKAALAAGVALREGDIATSVKHAMQAEAARPRAPGRLGDTVFDDFRDVCDWHCGFFEVLTTTGKYYWVATEAVTSIAFAPPARLRDLFWRRAEMDVAGGPQGVVYLPALYVNMPHGGDAAPLSDQIRLGRATDWQEIDALAAGVGQRLFLAGEDGVPIMDLTTLEFDQ